MGLVYIVHIGLRSRIMTLLELPEPEAQETNDYPLWIASGVIMETSVIAAMVDGDSFRFIEWIIIGTVPLGLFWLFILTYARVLFAVGFALIFEPLEIRDNFDLINVNIMQIVFVVVVTVLYGGTIILALFGSQIYGP